MDQYIEGQFRMDFENSMDTDWDVSGVDPSQYRLLFSTLGAIAGVKDVG